MPLRPGHKHSRIIDGQRYVWYVETLIEQAQGLPVFDLEIDTVEELDQDCWFGSTTVPTVRRVIAHCARILEADLSHPILLNADGSLMDGGHRLGKAILEGRRTVKAVRFDTMPPPDRIEPA